MSASTSTPIGSFLQAVISIVQGDATKTALPVLLNFLTNISSITSSVNLAAQLAALQVNLLAALPNIEQAVIKDIAAILEADLQALVPTPAPSTPPAA